MVVPGYFPSSEVIAQIPLERRGQRKIAVLGPARIAPQEGDDLRAGGGDLAHEEAADGAGGGEIAALPEATEGGVQVIRHRDVPEAPAGRPVIEQQLKAAAGSGGLTWGVILVGLGTLWLIDRYFYIDWSFMEEWGGPAAFILLGVILIVSHIRKRRAENEAQVGMPPRSR